MTFPPCRTPYSAKKQSEASAHSFSRRGTLSSREQPTSTTGTLN
nr:MAG TPA: hypothetical protein [Caudoviricetes sp.]